MENEKLCLRCMRKIGDSNVCPYCTNESKEPQKAPFLPLKTVVGGKYLIGKKVSSNGDGITYYGFDLEKKTPVTVRECFPKGEVTRSEDNYCLVNVGKAAAFIDAKAKFTKLWSALKEIKGFSALVPVIDVFEDLGTSYAVTEYVGESETLRDFLLRNEQGYISWEEARILLMPVLSALGALHENGIIHGAVSPNSLVVDKDGKVKIIDFSIDDVRKKGTHLEAELSDGYSAIEQYAEDGSLGSFTDVYGFSTVLYRVLVGSTPIDAVSRATNDKLMIPGKFAELIPAYVVNALVNALQILPEDRTETVEDLRNDLSASPAAAVSAQEAYSELAASRRSERDFEVLDVDSQEDDEEDYIPQKQGVKKSTVVTFVVSVLVCLVLLVGVIIGINGFSDDGDEENSTTTEEAVEATSDMGELEDDFVSVTLIDFRGKTLEEVKNDEKYKQVLIINTEYADSDKEKGTIIAQSLAEGTVLSSINKRTITLKVSDGLLVPDVDGKDVSDVLKTLSDLGFKNVETEVSDKASSEADSNKVTSIVYCPENDDKWENLPGDRRIDASNKVIVYCYGEYTPPETTSQTEPSFDFGFSTDDNGDENLPLE